MHLIESPPQMRKLFLNVSEQPDKRFNPNSCPIVAPFESMKEVEAERFRYAVANNAKDPKTGKYPSVTERKYMAKRDYVVAQEFIKNPLTLRGHKFHLRTFFMVANYRNPFVVLYGNSFCMIAMEQYDSDNIHRTNSITNRAISKHTITGAGDMADWAWSLELLAMYIDNLLNNGTGFDKIENNNDDINGINDAQLIDTNPLRLTKSEMDYLVKKRQFFEENTMYDSNKDVNFTRLVKKENDYKLQQIAIEHERETFKNIIVNKYGFTSGIEWVDNILIENIKKYGSIIWRAGKYRSSWMFEKEQIAYWTQHYELLAMDWLIDGNSLELKLMEVQNGPQSSFIPKDCNNKTDKVTKQRQWACKMGKAMIEESINIEIEIAMKKSFYQKITQIDSINYWTPVVWDYEPDWE